VFFALLRENKGMEKATFFVKTFFIFFERRQRRKRDVTVFSIFFFNIFFFKKFEIGNPRPAVLFLEEKNARSALDDRSGLLPFRLQTQKI